MSDYLPPYPQAEVVFAADDFVPMDYPDRHFIINDPEEGGYWIRNDEGRPDGNTENRDEAGIWTGEEMHDWGFGRAAVEMLPILAQAAPEAQPAVIPAAEKTVGIDELKLIELERKFIVRQGEKYWRNFSNGTVHDRNEAYVYAFGEVERMVGHHVASMVYELLPLTTSTATEAPSEIPITPGVVLFNLLKNNPKRETGGNYKDKATLLKWMGQVLKDSHMYSVNDMAAGSLPNSTSVGVLALMVHGDNTVITTEEYRTLERLTTACHARLQSICTVPRSEITAILQRGVEKALGY